MAEREEPVLAKQNSASPSPEPPDKEAPSSSLQPPTEPPQAGPQENLDKDSTEPREEPAAATPTTTLVENPVYFVSTVLRDARERYPMQQKLLFSLLSASRKLRHYFQGHPIKVVTSYPLEQVLRNPNATDRVASWGIELQPFELEFDTTRVIKGRALADFMAEWMDTREEEPQEEEAAASGGTEPGHWTMHFDGALSLIHI